MDLEGEPQTPRWPGKTTVRACKPGVDERTVYEVWRDAFRDHWGHYEASFEDWSRHNMGFPDHDPGLWFLAEEEGEAAGIALCKMNPAYGWVDTLGVRRPWRGRGLGTALLLHAFGEFRRRGAKVVRLGVDSENLSGATRLYERAGMRVVAGTTLYQRDLL